ncbi:DUF4194 domain-containing protein [Desulfobulbus rhabdoformis]|uniref:DUF4194 domain-containing protein n=1 Tax=Desulfobulbus rhabdoformis TaxID=34032 RepID=UPI0019653D83|nr:DUF4194 domain-containing protein [Desulfobulbus rhabdoformis]MBM9615018.1 DUF4194 domain-containing protein [Desulfobulbus rhabdoformis]
MDKGISKIVISLMKGVLYKEPDSAIWQQLIREQGVISEYVSVMGLSLLVDESEGYAFLKYREQEGEEEVLPRLIGRRQLSYPVSLLLALLRHRLAEFDASGEDTRLIMSRDEIVEMVSTFLPSGVNEARLVDKIDSHISKVVELGFVRRMPGKENSIEVKRILKAYINAHWLSEMDQRLKEYQTFLQAEKKNEGGAGSYAGTIV